MLKTHKSIALRIQNEIHNQMKTLYKSYFLSKSDSKAISLDFITLSHPEMEENTLLPASNHQKAAKVKLLCFFHTEYIRNYAKASNFIHLVLD